MSTYHFGQGRGRLSAAKCRALNTIARLHGAAFVHASLPEGYRYWFRKESEGRPFDAATARAVLADAASAGLL